MVPSHQSDLPVVSGTECILLCLQQPVLWVRRQQRWARSAVSLPFGMLSFYGRRRHFVVRFMLRYGSSRITAIVEIPCPAGDMWNQPYNSIGRTKMEVGSWCSLHVKVRPVFLSFKIYVLCFVSAQFLERQKIQYVCPCCVCVCFSSMWNCMLITGAARSTWTVCVRSNSGIVGSNPTQGTDVLTVCVYSVFVLLCV
jgi:hypothetical protein